MPQYRILAFLATLLLLLSPAWAENQTTIKGGQSAGPFQLQGAFSEVSRTLGSPSSESPSSGDPGTVMKFYKKQQLAFLVNPKGKIIGITVARKDWKTADGLGVGSPLLAFQELFGKGLKRGRGQTAFPQHGLAVSHESGLVKMVFVVKKDAKDAIKGDHLVIGGTRAGEMRLGNSAKDMRALLGSPPKTSGGSDNIWVYANHGIRLAFVDGRLHLIGVTSGDWVTPSGLKVGRPFADMKRELGSDYRVDRQSVFYDKWGLGARLQGDQIVELLIFNPRKHGGQG